MKKTYKKPSIVSEDLSLCLVTHNCTMTKQEFSDLYNSDEIGIGDLLPNVRIFLPDWPGQNTVCTMTPQEYNDQNEGPQIPWCYLNPNDGIVLFNS